MIVVSLLVFCRSYNRLLQNFSLITHSHSKYFTRAQFIQAYRVSSINDCRVKPALEKNTIVPPF
jgi:hypothetical protein